MNVYESIMQGLNEVLEYERDGKDTARKVTMSIAEVPDISPEEIKNLRKSMNMTQNTFAAAVGVSKKLSRHGRQALTLLWCCKEIVKYVAG